MLHTKTVGRDLLLVPRALPTPKQLLGVVGVGMRGGYWGYLPQGGGGIRGAGVGGQVVCMEGLKQYT